MGDPASTVASQRPAAPAEGVPCPLCGGPSSFLLTAPDRNLGVPADPFRYNRCELCGVVFLVDVPDDLGRHYPEAYFPLLSRPELEEAAEAEGHKVELVRAHASGGRLVEVGPGQGAFAYAAKRAGFEVTTIEMDARNCEHLRSVAGVEAVESAEPETALLELPKSRVIALWHVLEHLARPWECLQSAARNLEDGGVITLAVPNPEAFGFRVLRSRWPHVDAPRHLHLIPARTLIGYAAALGLSCEELTTTDPGARHWNVFAWQRAIGQARGPGQGGRLSGALGLLAATALAPIERRDLKGSTYTAVLRKPATGAASPG